MKNLKVNNSLFYGISNSFNESSIDILERILKDGYILNRSGLEFGTNNQKDNINEKQNSISLCFHPTNERLHQILKNTDHDLACEPTIFSTIVNNNNPSIVLDSILLKELKVESFNEHTQRRNEIKVLENIPLNYMTAIAYGDNIAEHLQNLKSLLKNYKENSQLYHDFSEYYYNVYIRSLLINRQNNVKLIRLLLDKFNISIPIINPLTGEEYQSYKEENEKLKKELCLIRKEVF